MFELAGHLVLLLVLAAFLAGFVDSIAGGGGLITLPALLLVGVDPVQALATNKLQGSFGSGTAALAYARAGQVRPREQLVMALIAGLAGGLGSALAYLIPPQIFRAAMPILLIAVAGFFALRPGLTDQDRARRLSPGLFAVTLVPAVALYDGLFGPGTGSFFMLGFVLLAGQGLLKATAHTKLLNFASNLGSVLVFASSGAVLWAVALAMSVGQVAGAALGARLAMRVGARVIRPLLIVSSTAMALRLIWQSWG
ncbi:TSUP family transporter [Xinfangfangia pollutisoli]|uniref:TSUP family transporter n=1 Tax=Xinfangfangia pollutisoli TaxID=2865960 RepID=UPI001CD691BF|nr:TSUP family transporter [Xinfangfangia pollutisoli]